MLGKLALNKHDWMHSSNSDSVNEKWLIGFIYADLAGMVPEMYQQSMKISHKEVLKQS